MILAIIRQDIKDLDMIEGVLKLTGFVRSAAGFTEQPKVIDGASDLLIELFKENGQHARTATGVAQLPFGASVQLDIIFQMKAASYNIFTPVRALATITIYEPRHSKAELEMIKKAIQKK